MRIPVLLLIACVGAALIVTAWPRFVGGAVQAPYEDTLRDLARGKTLDDAALKEAQTALRVARGWIDSAENRFLSGGISLVEARRAKEPLAQRATLDLVISNLSDGLRRHPAQSYAWLQLAQATRALRGSVPEVEKFLAVSLDLAPWEHRMVMPRLDIALATWPRLSKRFKSTLPGQFERAVDTAPLALARAVRRNFALRAAREMLEHSPVHRDRFRIVYLSQD